jgi:hypothetical protein
MAVEFFRQQYTTVPPLEPRDLAGQIVVITGASQGVHDVPVARTSS